jgi:molybdate transport system substrate-binding protein
MPRWLLNLLWLPALLLPQTLAAAAEARVAVASNFLHLLKELAPLFEEQTGHRLRISSASSGKLYAQIHHGAPFDLFLSADRERPRRLAAVALANPHRVRSYAIGQLLLWLPEKQGDAAACRAWLKQHPGLRLAIANPRIAPYGAAARETLRALGLAPEKMNLVFGENIAQTLAFVTSGNTDGGFIATSQFTDNMRRRGCHWRVPATLHRPLEQVAVLLKRGEANPAARDFFNFLFGREARQRIGKAGYLLP